MKTSACSKSRTALGLALVVLSFSATGCQRPTAHVEIKSYKDPYFPEIYDIDFDHCAFRHADSGDVHLAAVLHDAKASRDGEWISQYLHVHVYWKPRPGRTFANSTTCNATYRYIVASEDGVAVYDGTGFAFPKERRDGCLAVEIESGRLRLESQIGDVPDFLGHAWIEGRFVAGRNEAEVARLVREMERLAVAD